MTELFGCDGHDVINGDSGEDIIVGGRGNDTLTAGNSFTEDTFVIRDSDGNDTITDFDPFAPDILRLDMAEMTTIQDVLDRITTDGSDVVITYDNGSTTRLSNTNASDLSATNFEFAAGPVCLAHGTWIDTPMGRRRIEALKPGDYVTTLDNGPIEILHVVQETPRFRDRLDRRRPVFIAQGALGPKAPDRDTVVSPQHRIIVQSYPEGQSVPVAAIKLKNRKGIRRMRGCQLMHY